MNKNINIDILKEFYNSSSTETKNNLEQFFGKEPFKPKDITEQVRTFEDAVAILGNDNQAVVDYYAITNVTCTKDILAFAKLRIIAGALNEGWKPTFEEKEYRYYPWFCIYTKEEYKKLNENKKKASRVVGRSDGSAIAIGGVGFANANVASSYSSTNCGSRLVFKSMELAEYCGKQFIDIWADYLLK